MSEIITQRVLQTNLEATWELAIANVPQEWQVHYMHPQESGRYVTGKATIQTTKQGLLGAKENSLSFFNKSVKVIVEMALYRNLEEYIRCFRAVKHMKYIPHWALHHDSKVRGHYIEELQEHVFSAIYHHMQAGLVFINSAYLEWLGGASAFELHLGSEYTLVDSPYVSGVIADPYPSLCRLKLTEPQVNLAQKNIFLDYHIAYHHDSLSNVLLMRDEIQSNWRFANT